MQQATEYRRKGLISGAVVLELLISTQLGFAVLLGALLLGLPLWVDVLLLAGTIASVLLVCSAEIHYIVDAQGLTRLIEPKVVKFAWLFRRDQIDWGRIESYTLDYDRNRSWQSYPYLLVRGRQPSIQWKIAGTSMHDEAFTKFVDGFVQSLPSAEQTPCEAATEVVERPIRKRSGFYHTKGAKLLSLVVAVFDVLLIAGVLTGTLSLSNTSLYSLVAVLLPGTCYLLYRTLHS